MEEKNLESLKQSFLDIFSSYISLEKQNDNEFQPSPGLLIPNSETPNFNNQQSNPEININVVLPTQNSGKIDDIKVNNRSASKNININLKKNTIVNNILNKSITTEKNYNSLSLIKEKIIPREKIQKAKDKQSLVVPMSFISTHPYNFLTGIENYYIEQNKKESNNVIKSTNNTNQISNITNTNNNTNNISNIRNTSNNTDIQDGIDYNILEQILFLETGKKVNLNETNNEIEIKSQNINQLNNPSYSFTSEERYLPLETSKEKNKLPNKKVNSKDLKLRTVNRAKAKEIAQKKNNTQLLIPAFAGGGQTNGPTVALIGDNASGKEQIVPMKENTNSNQNNNSISSDTNSAAKGNLYETKLESNPNNSFSKTSEDNKKLKENPSEELKEKEENTTDPVAAQTKNPANGALEELPVNTMDSGQRSIKQNTTSDVVGAYLNLISKIPSHRVLHM